MKKAIQILLLAFTFFSFSFTSIDPNIIGEWKGGVDGEIGSFIFKENGEVYFTSEGETVGGKNYVMDGDTVNVFFETNTNVKPYSIDIVIQLKKDKSDIDRLKGIYEFISKDKLRLCLDFDEISRPIDFKSNLDDVLVMDRTK